MTEVGISDIVKDDQSEGREMSTDSIVKDTTVSVTEPSPLVSDVDRDRLLEETLLEETIPLLQQQLHQQSEFDEEVALWSKELKVLSAMGFNDFVQLLPLLKEHIEVPASKQHDGANPETGLQTVVLALLSAQ